MPQLGLGLGIQKMHNTIVGKRPPFYSDLIQWACGEATDGIVPDKKNKGGGVLDGRDEVLATYIKGDGIRKLRITGYPNTAFTYYDVTTQTTENGVTDASSDWLIPTNNATNVLIDGYKATFQSGLQDTKVAFNNYDTGDTFYGEIQGFTGDDVKETCQLPSLMNDTGYTISDGVTYYYDQALTQLVPTGKLSANLGGKTEWYIAQWEDEITTINNADGETVVTETLHEFNAFTYDALLQNGETITAEHDTNGDITSVALTGGTYELMSDYPNISESIETNTGSIASGTNTLTLDSTHDFVIGQGIAIKGAGAYRDGWLRTTVTNVVGNTITIFDNASATITNNTIEHDDTLAIQNAINSCVADVLVWDIKTVYAHEMSLPSNMHHYGKGCSIYTPKYCNQDTPSVIWNQFYFEDVVNISFIGFYQNGGKLYGVNGNDQHGTTMFACRNLEGAMFTDCHFEENFYLGFMMMDTQKNTQFNGCQIDQTDVAILHFPYYLSTANFENVSISECSVSATGSNSEAISFTAAYYDWRNHTTGDILASCKNIKIVNNTVIKRGRTAFTFGAITDGLLFKGNYVEADVPIKAIDGVLELRDELNVYHPEWCTLKGVVVTENNFAWTLYENIITLGEDWDIYNNTYSDVAVRKISNQESVGNYGPIKVHDQAIVIDDWFNFINGVFDNLQFYNNTMNVDRAVDVINVPTGYVNAYSNISETATQVQVPINSDIENGNFTTVVYV